MYHVNSLEDSRQSKHNIVAASDRYAYPSKHCGCKLHVCPVLCTAICAQLLCQRCHLCQLVTDVGAASSA